MADIGKVLKDEIARISKREAKSLMAAHIKTIRNLKLEMAELKKRAGKSAVKLPTATKVAITASPEGKSVWFTSKGIQGMRQRLGLSRAQMASLCGVSANAVVLWENAKAGKLNLRRTTRDALISLRLMTPAAAKRSLSGK